MKKLHNLCGAVSVAGVLLSGCGEVRTCTLPQVLVAADSPQSLFRGVDYLGSDEAYHYFDYKKELARDILFRVNRADYTPAEEWEYCRWRSRRKAFDYQEMILNICMDRDRFRYRIGNREFRAPAEIPSADWQKIRLVNLPSKDRRLSRRAEQVVLPFLKHPGKTLMRSPVSGMSINPLAESPGAGSGNINVSVIDEMMNKQTCGK